ncbi:MAG: porin family protein [Bacteroidota bacterium]
MKKGIHNLIIDNFKLIISFLIPYTLYLTPVAHSQQFKVGLLGGISTSQVDGDTYAGYDKAGFFAGGFVTKKFFSESKWSASFEITYIQKGSRKIPHPDKGDYSEYKLNLNYAEVPILIKYAFSVPDSASKQKIKFQLEGGVAVGALVQSKEGPVLGGVPFQKFDYSTILGLNYFLSEHTGFNVRYEYSIFPVRKGSIAQYYQNWTYKFLKPGYYNNLLIFSLHYLLK